MVVKQVVVSNPLVRNVLFSMINVIMLGYFLYFK